MAEKIFPRFAGSNINLESREQTSTVGQAYRLTLVASPLTFPPGGQTAVRFNLTLNGERATGTVTVLVDSSNQQIGFVPATLQMTDGVATLAIIGLGEGQSEMGGSVVIGDVVFASNKVTIYCNTTDQREDYAAKGYGRVQVNVEPAIAAALTPRIERLSHEEQQTKYPWAGDDGLKWATYFSNRDVEFIPAGLDL